MTDAISGVICDFARLTDEYLPNDIFGRESQIIELQKYLSPVKLGRKPFHIWLHGRPGTGKTAVAHYVANQIESSSNVEVAFVNCWQNPTLFLVLQQIIETLRIVVPDNANTVVKLHRIVSKLGGTPLILVLDEIDKAPPRERNSIIYNLCQLNNVGIVAICNSREELFYLEDRVKSRFDPVQIWFDPYSKQTIRRILEEVARSALSEGSWTPDVLDNIAELAAGDARVAIQTLRNAAQHAELDSSRVITREHVKLGWTNALNLKAEYMLKNMTAHHRSLVEIVKAHAEITSGLLWAAYLEQCKETNQRPIANRTYNLYINSLVSQGILERERASIQGNVYTLRLRT